MPPLRKRSRKRNAPAAVLFSSAQSPSGKRQPCIYAQCQIGDTVVGPIWGHAEQSLRAALAELSRNCECPARFHVATEFQGRRIPKAHN